MRRPRYLIVLWETFLAFGTNHGFGLAAAMSFYAILSLAPLVVLLLWIAGFLVDREAVSRELVAHVQDVMGTHAAEVTRTIVEHGGKPLPGGSAMIVGIGMLIFGATGMFTQLQDSLNLIWKVESAPGRSVWRFLRTRLTALIMVVCVESLLLISPAMTTLVTLVNARLVGRVPAIAEIWQWLHLLASIVVITLVFAALFKILPHIKVWWSDVWVAAAGSALMFTLGQFVIGRYLAFSGVASIYGAAGSLVALLIWVYYSSLILFLGAQFTQVHAFRFGSRARISAPQPSPARAPAPRSPAR